jgi:hypothetical protein
MPAGAYVPADSPVFFLDVNKNFLHCASSKNAVKSFSDGGSAYGTPPFFLLYHRDSFPASFRKSFFSREHNKKPLGISQG